MGKLTNEEWFTILCNLEDMEDGYLDGEINNLEIIYVDSTDSFSLCHGHDLFEDGFKTEEDATNRLYELVKLYRSHKKEKLNFDVVVSCDCEIVFDGNVLDFISINENDSFVIDKCVQLLEKDKINFTVVSGQWEIKRV